MTSSWFRQAHVERVLAVESDGKALVLKQLTAVEGSRGGYGGRALRPWECPFPTPAGLVISAEVHSRGLPAWHSECLLSTVYPQVGVARQEPEGVCWSWKECEGRRPSGWGPQAGQRAEGNVRS